MKKLLLSCDEYAYFYDGKYYLGEFGAILINRYLAVFDKVRFAIRTKYITSIEELGKHNIPIDDKRIEVFTIPFFQGPKEYAKQYFKIHKKLRQVASGCDMAVYRLPSTVAFACLNVTKNRLPYAVEVVANPYEIKQNSKDILSKFFFSSWDFYLRRACLKASAVSYVTKKKLQQRYKSSESSYKSYYSSIEMDSSFFEKVKQISKGDKIKIAHVATNIKTFSKGHMSVIRVVQILKEKGYDVEALFAGEGEYVAYFKEKAKELSVEENIKFIGVLDRTSLISLLESSNIMIFPSSSEGLPRVLLEAMAMGLPCLSTPVGGIPELLESEFLFEPNDFDSFARKTEEIFSDVDLYNQLSIKNFKKALEYEKQTLDKRRTELYQFLYNSF